MVSRNAIKKVKDDIRELKRRKRSAFVNTRNLGPHRGEQIKLASKRKKVE